MASEGAACAQLGVERLSYLLDGLRRLQDRCVAPAPCDCAAVQPADSNVCSKAPRRIPTPGSPGGGGLSRRLSANWTRRSRARKSVAICKYGDVYPPPGPCGFQHAVTDSVSRYVCRRRAGWSGRQQTRMHDPRLSPNKEAAGQFMWICCVRAPRPINRYVWAQTLVDLQDKTPGWGREGGWGGCPGDTD